MNNDVNNNVLASWLAGVVSGEDKREPTPEDCELIERAKWRDATTSSDHDAIELLAKLMDDWYLLPKAEEILSDAQLYLFDRGIYLRLRDNGCRACKKRTWRVTAKELWLASMLPPRRRRCSEDRAIVT
jgi:hypothetical protein